MKATHTPFQLTFSSSWYIPLLVQTSLVHTHIYIYPSSSELHNVFSLRVQTVFPDPQSLRVHLPPFNHSPLEKKLLLLA